MIKKFTVAICLFLLFVSGCAYTYYPDDNISSMHKWHLSPNTKNGYVYIYGEFLYSRIITATRYIHILNNNPDIERIRVVINNTRGDAASVDNLINTIILSKKPVDIIASGYCYGKGIEIYAAATGNRYAFEDTKFVISGKSERERALIEKIIRHDTGTGKADFMDKTNHIDKLFSQSREWIVVTGKEALEYHLVDDIITAP